MQENPERGVAQQGLAGENGLEGSCQTVPAYLLPSGTLPVQHRLVCGVLWGAEVDLESTEGTSTPRPPSGKREVHAVQSRRDA